MIYLLNISSTHNAKSALVHWSKYRHDVGGFVCVKVLNKLTLRQFSTATYTQFEVKENYQSDTTEINNFILAKKAFDISRNWMRSDMESEKLKYFILDEVGSLEIDNLGHDALVREIIKKDNADQVFILLVRQPLIEMVQEKYNFQNKKVISLKQVTG